jgi:HSP20 family protein
MRGLATRDDFFRDLFDFRRDFDHMFNRFLTGTRGNQLTSGERGETSMPMFAPAVESYVDRENKKFICRVALPGVDPKDVNIHVQGNVLTISGERNVREERNESDYVYREMIYGSFERAVPLPEGIDSGKVDAEYRNGILEITAPISAAALPRRIEIKGGESHTKQIGASASGR